MKLPSYDVPSGQKNIEYSEFTHNRPQDPAYNPGRPSKVPTSYPKSGAGKAKVGKVMHEYKEGTLHAGKSGKMVKSRAQAIAIALSEGRKAEGKKRKKS